MQTRPRSAPPPRRPAARPATRRAVRATLPSRMAARDRLQAYITAARLANMQVQSRLSLLRKIKAAESNSRKQQKLVKKLRKKYGLSLVTMNNRLTVIRAREILGINMSAAGRERLAALGFRILRRTALRKLGVVVDLYEVPEGMTDEEALEAVRGADSKGLYRHNATYELMGWPEASTGVPEQAVDQADTLPEPIPGQPAIKVGMLDTGVHAEHKYFKNFRVEQSNWGRGAEVMPRDHGTAVAHLLKENGSHALYVADVFSGPNMYADVESIVVGLNWLAEQGVGVINISLAGPPDILLQHVVSKLVADGHILVAAVGNTGPESPPMYPAAYDGVVGVTATDQKHNIFVEAYQGPAVDFAAKGVAVKAASLDGRKSYSGTSFATPVVSGYLSNRHEGPDRTSALKALDAAFLFATDKGAAGYDPLYGHGLLDLAPGGN